MAMSLIEPTKEPRGECKGCRNEERCNAWWRKDVENGAICVGRVSRRGKKYADQEDDTYEQY